MRRRNLTTLFLSALMGMGTFAVPVSTFAVGNLNLVQPLSGITRNVSDETELKNALSSAEAGDTIKLTASFSVTNQIDVTIPVIFDLGGNKLDYPTASYKALFNVNCSSGNVVIQNGSLCAGTKSSWGNNVVKALGSSQVQLIGIKAELLASSGYVLNAAGSSHISLESSEIHLPGSFTMMQSGDNQYSLGVGTVLLSDGGAATITQGRYISGGNGVGILPENASLEYSVYGDRGIRLEVKEQEPADLIGSLGSYTTLQDAVEAGETYVTLAQTSGSTEKMLRKSVIPAGKEITLKILVNNNKAEYYYGDVEVQGKLIVDILTNDGGVLGEITTSGSGLVEIPDFGTFKTDVRAWLKNNRIAVQNNQGLWQISSSQGIKGGSGTIYTSIDAAIAAGETVLSLTTNITSNIEIPSGKNITINLNGYEIAGWGTRSATAAITVDSGATLTVNGPGAIKATRNYYQAEEYCVENHGTLTLNEVNVEGSDAPAHVINGPRASYSLNALIRSDGNLTLKDSKVNNNVDLIPDGANPGQWSDFPTECDGGLGILVTGGTVDVVDSTIHGGYTGVEVKSGDVTFEGNDTKVTAESGRKAVNGSKDNITIKAGTYSSDIEDYVDSDSASKAEDGSWVVTAPETQDPGTTDPGDSGSGSGDSGTGSGSGSGNNSSNTKPDDSKPSDSKTETVENPDGTTTEKVTDSDGTVTSTTEKKDGSIEQKIEKPDGSTSTTTTHTDGSKDVVATDGKGTTTTSRTEANGMFSSVTQKSDNTVSGTINVTKPAIESAEAVGSNIIIKMPEIPANRTDNKVELDVTVPTDKTATVEIPVIHSTIVPGSVAMIQNEDGSLTPIQTSYGKDGQMIVPIESSAKIIIKDNAKSFTDVSKDSPYSNGIDFVSARKIMNGSAGEGSPDFNENGVLTRGMLAQMFWNLAGNPASSASAPEDAKGYWYENASKYVTENKMMGVNSAFRGGDPISREELALILYRAAGSPKADLSLLAKYSDADQIQYGDGSRNAFAWAISKNILGENTPVLMPRESATRGQIAKVMMNYIING